MQCLNEAIVRLDERQVFVGPYFSAGSCAETRDTPHRYGPPPTVAEIMIFHTGKTNRHPEIRKTVQQVLNAFMSAPASTIRFGSDASE